MTALVILAAGGSVRLGRPKQNLIFRGKTMLQNAVETALDTKCDPIFVVLGAEAVAIGATLNYPGVQIISNPDWQDGLASSIRIAVQVIQEDKEIDSMVIMLCDQPFVNPQLIDHLLTRGKETHKPIIACAYEGGKGVPVLFNRSMFAKLQALTGQQGAKKIIKAHPQDVIAVPFGKGGTDIDTMADYKLLLELK
jgi:molybdenum cofactor cytidylyltransferase